MEKTIADIFHIPAPSEAACGIYKNLYDACDAASKVEYYKQGFAMMGCSFGTLMNEVLRGERSWQRIIDVLYRGVHPVPSKTAVISLAHEALASKGMLLPSHLIQVVLLDFS